MTPPGGAPANRTVRLSDGRTLSWYEFGHPSGVPCLYLPGTPESGLAGGCYHTAASAAGVRWISIDKPGYGHSDPSPGRRLTDWPDDVAQLTDHLGLGRFAVAGESGGGPHALAVGRRLPDRIPVVVLLASAVRIDPGSAPAGMNPVNRLLVGCTRIHPGLVRAPFGVLSFLVRHETTFPGLAGLLGRGVPDVDLAAMGEEDYELRLRAGPDAFRQGGRPAAEEFLLISGPWGFDPAEVGVPVQMWHGALDTHVPISLAERLGRELPDVVRHFREDAAHTVGFQRRAEVMAVVGEALGAQGEATA